MPNLTPEKLTEIEARCKAATGGPWYAINIVVGDGGKRTGIYQTENASGSVAYCFRFSDDIVPDAEFLAHARQDLPDCLAEIKRLWGLLSVAKCPNCDGSGCIAHQVSSRQYVTRDMAIDAGDESLEGSLYSDDEWEQEQCQWCDEVKALEAK